MRSFLIGLGVGLGLGMLFAPVSGAETRMNLTDRASDLAETAREAMQEGRERVKSTLGRSGGEELSPTGTSL